MFGKSVIEELEQVDAAKPTSDALQGRFTAVSVGNKAQCGSAATVVLVLVLVCFSDQQVLL